MRAQPPYTYSQVRRAPHGGAEQHSGPLHAPLHCGAPPHRTTDAVSRSSAAITSSPANISPRLAPPAPRFSRPYRPIDRRDAAARSRRTPAALLLWSLSRLHITPCGRGRPTRAWYARCHESTWYARVRCRTPANRSPVHHGRQQPPRPAMLPSPPPAPQPLELCSLSSPPFLVTSASSWCGARPLPREHTPCSRAQLRALDRQLNRHMRGQRPHCAASPLPQPQPTHQVRGAQATALLEETEGNHTN